MHNAHKYTEIRIGKEDMHRNAQKANIYNECTDIDNSGVEWCSTKVFDIGTIDRVL